MQTRHRGVTLLELIVVVAIIGLLAAIAYPSYNEHVKKTRRADAAGALMGLASALERQYTTKFTYKGNAVGNADTGTPAIYASQVPVDGGTKSYYLQIVAADDSHFIIRAIPTGPQVGDGFLQLSSTGERGWDRNDNGKIDADEKCWEKSC